MPRTSDFRAILVSGVFYTALSKYAGMVILLAVSAILARLVSPEDFGVVAVATVFINFFAVLYNCGLGTAVIQHGELSEDEVSDIFSFSVYVSVALAAVFFAMSPLVAATYGNGKLAAICMILSANILFASLNTVPDSLFSKHKRFRFIAVRTVLVQAVLGVASSVAAYRGLGIYSLLVNPVLGAVMLFAIGYAAYPIRFKPRFSMATIRKIFPYSAFQFLFNFINYFSRNLDNLLVGKFIGMEPLGYYEKSYRLMSAPMQMITHVVTPVVHPVFADYKADKKKIYGEYVKIVRFLAGIGLPLSAFLFFAARELVLVVFGAQWDASVPAFRLLALSAGTQVVMSSSGAVFQAAGDTKSLFVAGVVNATTVVAGICVGVFYFRSVTATAGCVSATITACFLCTYGTLIRHTLRQSLLPFLKGLVSPACCAACCALCLFLCDRCLSGGMLLTFGAKLAVFAALLLAFDGRRFKKITTIVCKEKLS
ncbi:MAG: lipopolysaccharide biosynthesis protein [Acidobacteriota bacterium]|jgi:PST family polysaccharide transporter|nr:lipopolysaccharide biosynthesis protein [Acidobacteriota bacterium]